jgi:hypothetical protein
MLKALCNSRTGVRHGKLPMVDSGLTASVRLYSMAGPLLGSRDVYRARVRHIVYVASAILFTSLSTVDCCLQQARHSMLFFVSKIFIGPVFMIRHPLLSE